MDKDSVLYIQPVLAHCQDRDKPSPENPIIGGPDDWRRDMMKIDDGTLAVSFDFFVDWSSDGLPVAGEYWFKFPIKTKIAVNLIDQETLKDVLRACGDFTRLAKCAQLRGVTVKAIVFDANQKYSESSSIVVFSFDGRDSSTSFEVITLKELMARIQLLSGGPVRMGGKGLRFGTTRLECFLSTTASLWPGDVDLLLMRKADVHPMAIFEFKKHTRNAIRNFEEQDISLFYPSPDGRKYKRLVSLARSFDRSVPMFLVFYCNFADQTDLIVQRIAFQDDEIVGEKSYRISGLTDSKSVAEALLGTF